MTKDRNSSKKVIVSIESLPKDIASYLGDNYLFYDLSEFFSGYKTIKNYDKNFRVKWDKIIKSLPDFPSPDIVIFRTYTVIDKQIIDLFPENILYLRAGSGYDNIDLKYAKAKNCEIENTPLANTNAAFEHTIALMFASTKKLLQFYDSTKNGKWRDNLDLNFEIYGKNILIVGYGNIGYKIADFCKSFGMNLYLYDPIKGLSGKFDFLPEFKNINQDIEFNINYEILYDLIKEVDIVSFHIPLYDKTYKIIDKKLLQNLKENAILINTSRGEIFNKEDVIVFFKNNKNKILATDVLPEEPCYENSEFFNLPNCIITPHIGAYTHEARIRLKEELIKSIENYLLYKKILYPANSQFYFSPYFIY